MKMKRIAVHIGLIIGLIGMSGCAEFEQWAKRERAGGADMGLDFVEAPPMPSQPPSGPEDVKAAVEELRGYLKEQETRIGGLLKMRAELETQMQEARDTTIVPLRERVETYEGRLQKHEAALTDLTNKLKTTVAPMREVVSAQGGRIDQLDQQVVVLIDSANQDKDALRTNLENFREALVGFHSIMNNLETLVYDEEFRATNVEERLAGQLTEEAKNRQELWKVSGEQGTVLAGMQEKMKGLATLEQRVVALHSYINKVRQGVGVKFDALQAQAVKHNGTNGSNTQPQSTPSFQRRASGNTSTSSVVPDFDMLIAPMSQKARGGTSGLDNKEATTNTINAKPSTGSSRK